MLLILLLFLSSLLPSARANDSPLMINIVADPLMRDRFSSLEEFKSHIRDFINSASLVFHAEVGRRLALGVVEIGLPPNAGFSIDDESAFAWLAEKAKRSPPSRFWVFLIDRPLASCIALDSWSGCAVINEPWSIVGYNSDSSYARKNLLHELGHNCGARHSADKNSIMHDVPAIGATSYKDGREIIKKNCGPA